MYVVYHKETTIIPQTKTRYANMFKNVGGKTERAAKSALTRMLKTAIAAGNPLNADDYAIAEIGDFRENIEKTRTVRNMLNPNGPDIEIGVNTPAHMDPSRESYHCM